MVVEYPSGDSDHDQSSDDEVEVKTLQSKYLEAQAQVKKKKCTKAEVHPVMDDIINADYCKLSCHQVPIMAYLENNKAAPSHLDCDPSQPLGCSSALAMPTKVLDLIVECAHIFKIQSLDDLQRETRWERVDKWGSEILSLIECLRPPPALPLLTTNLALPLSASTSTNLASTSTNMVTPASQPRTPTTCGLCSAQGHNTHNKKFHPSTGPSVKENAPLNVPPS
ncbi:hypothetical protein L208DRAFT_1381376 [Tricholoma matsutake]|nr:hypothetical protein L208DRAFT_1381376 [Tricholoma matsutake 945]